MPVDPLLAHSRYSVQSVAAALVFRVPRLPRPAIGERRLEFGRPTEQIELMSEFVLSTSTQWTKYIPQ